MFKKLVFLGILILLASCSSKKEILYLQDAEKFNDSEVLYTSSKIQPNDILSIKVETLIPEAALPYNRQNNNAVANNIDLLKLEGYLVLEDRTINFPILGSVFVGGKTTSELEEVLKNKLIEGNHLKNPNVSIRLLNAKVTVIGEVNKPGTYSFTEQNITLFQAIGLAGDLTINGKREDVLVVREVDGNRQVTRLDLTKGDFLQSPFYFIKPNDVIVVNQNDPKVKSAGFIGDIGTVLTIASLALSVTILLTR